MKAALYLRQSLAKDGDDLAIERQRAECLKLCESRGYEVVETLIDNNRSATTGPRPGYEQLLHMIELNVIDVVVVLRHDRLLRRLADLEHLIGLSERTGVLIATVHGELQLDNATGRLLGRILASVARAEVETKGERHKLANKQRAKAGLPHKGRRAFGYQADGLTIDEGEAVAIKEVATRFLSGWSYDELAAWLNTSGYRTTMGNSFYGVAVRQMLMRVRYCGVREHDGIAYPAQWPAILDSDTFQLIQYKMRERSDTYNKPAPRKYLLTGLLVCGGCGARMNGTTTYDRKTGAPRHTYRCNRMRTADDGGQGCGKVSRGSVPLEHFLAEMIFYRLSTPLLHEQLSTTSKESLQVHDVQVAQARLDALLDDYTDGTLTKPEFIRARRRAQDALQRAETALAAAQRTQTVSGLLSGATALRERWETEPAGWRRQLLDLLVESIEVMPTRKLPRYKVGEQTFYFAPEAIRVTWKA